MRLFVAAYPSEAALRSLRRLVADLPVARFASEHDVNVRLTDPALWHLTLAFLGEVPDIRLADVASALDAAAAATEPATSRLTGGGTFGRGRFTTLWVGVHGDGLGAVATTVRVACKRARVPYDRKPFRPHLTVGRPGDRAPREVVRDTVDELNRYTGPAWVTSELRLVASYLGPKPQHEVLHSARLSR